MIVCLIVDGVMGGWVGEESVATGMTLTDS